MVSSFPQRHDGIRRVILMKLIPTSAVFSDKGPDSSVSSDGVFADDDYGVYAVADGQGYIEGMRPPAEIFVEVVKAHVALLARAFADVEPTDPDPYRVRKAVVVLFSKVSAAIRREYGLVSPLRLQDGDCLALMTDGIHGVVEDAEVMDCHAGVYSTEQLAKAFAGLAARRTKEDRSCVVIDVEDEDARLEEEDEDAE